MPRNSYNSRTSNVRVTRSSFPKRGLKRRVRRLKMMTGLRFAGPKYFIRTLNLSNVAAANFQTLSTSGTLNQTSSGDVALSSSGVAVKSYYSLALAFALSDLPDYTEFTTLFDAYIIKAVKLKITGYNTVSQYGLGPGGFAGLIMHHVSDFDDNTPFAASEAGINAMREYQTYKTANMCDTKKSVQTFFIKPAVALAAYGGSVFTSYARKKNQWIDCQSAGVPHYGKKILWEMSVPGGAAYESRLKCEVTYYIGLKDVR